MFLRAFLGACVGRFGADDIFDPMQSAAAAQLVAEQDATTASAHAVLFSSNLWFEMWPWLDRGSKQALRCVCRPMRSQVDGSITRASRSSGVSAAKLTRALVRWPGIVDLTLMNVRSGSDLRPLCTASLACLTSLAVRQAVMPPAQPWFLSWAIVQAPRAKPWVTTMLSSHVAATLQVLDFGGCANLSSIDAVRSCPQPRCLWMPGCVGVSSLSLLSACSQLEELWMAGNPQIDSLMPLQGCPKLRKLDLRGCDAVLFDQVEELRLACTQLADPASVELEGLVHEIQLNMPPGMQNAAAVALRSLARRNSQNQVAITAAGAIPPLVKLLGADSSAAVQQAAARALRSLAWSDDAHIHDAITTAGAFPSLVKLLGPGSSSHVQATGARALQNLAGHAQNQVMIIAARAIPPL
ncbi:hypothetical protein FOA52_012087 [Chlamydomonas sp. UWO 241]|nr:hypothetical protein FOA52_012087 [Chlamydomonas sp. UWO 241]